MELVTLTNRALLSTINTLRLINEKNPEVPGLTAYKLTKLFNALKPEGSTAEQAIQSIGMAHAARDENGDIVPGEKEGTIKIANAEAYMTAVNAVLDVE